MLERDPADKDTFMNGHLVHRSSALAPQTPRALADAALRQALREQELKS
ncbi:MAG: hypothetical protein AAFY69_14820 [Pseudomonadota bacterium]